MAGYAYLEVLRRRFVSAAVRLDPPMSQALIVPRAGWPDLRRAPGATTKGQADSFSPHGNRQRLGAGAGLGITAAVAVGRTAAGRLVRPRTEWTLELGDAHAPEALVCV